MPIEELVKRENGEENSLTSEERLQLNILNILLGEIKVEEPREPEIACYTNLIDINERDGLTNVYNRRKFDMDLGIEVQRAYRTERDVSLFMIDIDHFKKYNDTHGHPEGDRILKELTQCLTGNLRPYDAANVYRYGGEEFTVLLPDTTNENGIEIAERLRNAVEQNCGITISMGVANYIVHTNHRTILDGEETRKRGDVLVKSVDKALYRAKKAGRNMVMSSKPLVCEAVCS